MSRSYGIPGLVVFGGFKNEGLRRKDQLRYVGRFRVYVGFGNGEDARLTLL